MSGKNCLTLSEWERLYHWRLADPSGIRRAQKSSPCRNIAIQLYRPSTDFELWFLTQKCPPFRSVLQRRRPCKCHLHIADIIHRLAHHHSFEFRYITVYCVYAAFGGRWVIPTSDIFYILNHVVSSAGIWLVSLSRWRIKAGLEGFWQDYRIFTRIRPQPLHDPHTNLPGCHDELSNVKSGTCLFYYVSYVLNNTSGGTEVEFPVSWSWYDWSHKSWTLPSCRALLWIQTVIGIIGLIASGGEWLGWYSTWPKEVN